MVEITSADWVNLLCYTPKSPKGDLLIIRDFHTPKGGRGHSRQPKGGIINGEIRKVSPPFEGGVAAAQ
jgi:hypothetical protein